MATSIGPLFALWVDTPIEWRRGLGLSDSECVIRSRTQGQAWVVDLVSKSLKAKLDQGQETWVFIAQIIREDGEALFAFETSAERALFVEIREIDSIGSKYAATAVSELGLAGIHLILRSASLPAIKIPGLGPKTLEKIRLGVKAKQDVFARILQSATQAASQVSGTSLSINSQSESTQSNSVIVNAVAAYVEVPDIILQALTKLGIKTSDAIRLFEDCTQAKPEFPKLAAGEQLKALLSRWGQYKKNKNPEPILPAEGGT